MAFHNRVSRALVPLIGAVFSTGIAAVVFAELGNAVADLPTHIIVMIFAVPAAYAVLSVLAMAGVIGKDGAVVISLIFVPVFIVLELFIMGFVIPIGIDGIG